MLWGSLAVGETDRETEVFGVREDEDEEGDEVHGHTFTLWHWPVWTSVGASLGFPVPLTTPRPGQDLGTPFFYGRAAGERKPTAWGVRMSAEDVVASSWVMLCHPNHGKHEENTRGKSQELSQLKHQTKVTKTIIDWNQRPILVAKISN